MKKIQVSVKAGCTGGTGGNGNQIPNWAKGKIEKIGPSNHSPPVFHGGYLRYISGFYRYKKQNKKNTGIHTYKITNEWKGKLKIE